MAAYYNNPPFYPIEHQDNAMHVGQVSFSANSIVISSSSSNAESVCSTSNTNFSGTCGDSNTQTTALPNAFYTHNCSYPGGNSSSFIPEPPQLEPLMPVIGRTEPGPDQLIERDVAEDAQWKRIQQNTFTRWANQHLKQVDASISNLETDLSDGLLLIKLVEVLSHKRLPKHNKKPTFRSQKLENVSVALNFLEKEEGIRLVNIDSSDIVDQRLKLILGLIWMLILHYSISIPVWDEADTNGHAVSNGQPKETPKQRLLGWIQSKIPDVGVNNFTSDWNDGKALGALVDSVAPGLAPEWATWKPSNALQNTSTAMDLADNYLGVPKLMEPDEMINPKVDEMSVMTYLSQYPNARLRTALPPKGVKHDASRVRAYGPGLQPNGVRTDSVTYFTIDAAQPGPANIEVQIRNPKGGIEPVDIQTKDEAHGLYNVAYTPRLEGGHTVTIKYAGREIPDSPYLVITEGPPADPSKVTVSGPGVEPGVMAGKSTFFEIYCLENFKAPPQVTIVDPSGSKDQIRPVVRRISDNAYRCEYVAQTPGLHSINVFYGSLPIPRSPIGVNVLPSIEPRNVRAWGRGLQSRGVRVGDKADFKVFTEGAGDGQLNVKVLTPTGDLERVEKRQINPTTTYCSYNPRHVGQHTVDISFGGQPIPKSPFKVNVGPDKPCRVRAYGPGLEGGMANLPCDFSVDTNGEVGALGFSIEGPSQAKIQCKDNGDGSAEVSYVPTAAGDYAVHVMCNDEDIPNSPFMVEILPYQDGVRPSLVRCTGPGLERRGVLKGHKADFTVDTRNAGTAPLKITGFDRDYDPIDINIRDNHDSTYSCYYIPKSAEKHTILVSYGSVAVPGSPYRVQVQEPIDPHKVRVYGPGVEYGVKSQTPTHFIIDCKQAGPGEVEVALSDDKGAPVDIDVLDNSDGSFTVKYTAPKPGPYQIRVIFAGSDIPGSPIRLNVQPHLDVGGIRVEGLDTKVFVDSTTEFQLDARSVSRQGGPGKVQCLIKSPTNKLYQAAIDDNFDGTYLVSYTPNEEGAYHLELLYEQIPLPRNPIAVLAVKGCDPSRVRAHGPGLEKGLVGVPAHFTVETKGAGTGGLGLAIEGPCEAQINCKDNRDGSCTVEYVPMEPGDYDITIKFADISIAGSPFKAIVDYPVDASKVFASGPGLEAKNCRANVPLTFNVDASRSGYAPLNVDVRSERGPAIRLPEIRERSNNKYEVVYYPTPENSSCSIHITYGGQEIPNSPYRMRVLPNVEPNKVIVKGDGVIPLGDIPASIPVTFHVDATNAGNSNLEVIVVGPDRQPVPVKVLDHGNATYDVTWIPDDAGPYSIVVKYGGHELPRSPYRIKAHITGDASKCSIMEGKQETIVIGEEYCITVDTSNAGYGNVTSRIYPNHPGAVPLDIDIEKNSDGTFSVYYTAVHPDQYQVVLKFGGQQIPNGQYLVWADRPENVQRENISSSSYSHRHNGHHASYHYASGQDLPPLEFWNIPLPFGSSGKIDAIVIMPSKKTDRPIVKENHDGSVTIKYQPTEKGLHEMHIKYNGTHVQGSPYQFHVDSVLDGYVTAYGPGLVYGTAGEPTDFTVCAKEAGAGVSILDKGGLSVSVEGPAKADIKCHDNKDGTCSVSWTPPAPGEYKIHVKFAEKDIHGSPFTAKIAGEGRKRAHISVGSTSEVSLKISEPDIKGLSASIRSPSGIEEPCFIRQTDEGHLGISFTPREVGEHLVSVKKKGTLIPSAPFRIHVGESEVGNSSKVKVSGPGVNQSTTQQWNSFVVDTRGAGFGGLSISIEGPSKCEIQCKDNKDGSCNIQYKPSEPGVYSMNIKFADHHVPGSPFTIKCTGTGCGTLREIVKTQRGQASVVSAGQGCELCLKIPGTNPLDMNAKLISPNGHTESIECRDVHDGNYVIMFKPRETGLHTISVMHKGQHVSGSPFQFTVGPFKEGGSHKVRAGGPGLVRGEVNSPASFNIYTREAGAGNLAIAVEGPSKAEIDFKDHRDGNCYVIYSVSKPGEYLISVKFNDDHIPDSPFKAYIASASGEARRLKLASFVSTGLQLNKPVTFTVLTHGAKGQLEAKVVGPRGSQDDCFVIPIDDESYAVRFVPKEPGNHYVHIKMDGAHMIDSPFRIHVGGSANENDAMAVTAHGDGLRFAETGQKCEFVVNTASAGAGSLQVTIDGPSKVSLDAYETDEGYRVRYTPLAPGEYFITTKFNNVHIPGSPFKLVVGGKKIGGSGFNEAASFQTETTLRSGRFSSASHSPTSPSVRADASKVEARGMGLKKAFVGRQNNFVIDASKAGQDMLWVSVTTPKGPIDEVYVKHTGHGIYNVNYLLKNREPGCSVYVKYGDKHIPGSPFSIDV